jgi:hypothetical protein
MQDSKGKRLKYVIATTATVAVLVGAAFIGKKCMREDIQNSEPERPKKTLVTENKGHEKKQAVEKLAKMVNGVTPLEEKNAEIIDGVEIVDDEEGTVKKIIAEYPYEKIRCEEITAKELRKRYLELNSFAEQGELEDPVEELIEKLGKERKVEQLLSILRYYESFGAYYDFTGEGDRRGIFSDYMKLNQEVWFSDEGDEVEYYDPECVFHLFNLEFRIIEVLEQLSGIWVREEYDPKSLIEALPRIYKNDVILHFVGEMMEDPKFSPEKFEQILYSFPEEYKEDIF